MNCFLIECLPTSFHRVPIRNAQVMAISKSRYRQLFGRSGWSVKNSWIITNRSSRMWTRERDQHTKFQLDRPIIAAVIPFFLFLVGRLVGPVCTHRFF